MLLRPGLITSSIHVRLPTGNGLIQPKDVFNLLLTMRCYYWSFPKVYQQFAGT
jgi:hypothetical protein